jgi:hypothetical protein
MAAALSAMRIFSVEPMRKNGGACGVELASVYALIKANCQV